MKKAPRPSVLPAETAFTKFHRAGNKMRLLSNGTRLTNIGRPSLVHKDSYEFKNTHSLEYKITFASDDYSYDQRFAPGIGFYKFLAKRSNGNIIRLGVSIPDTIVFNESMIPVWIYTGLDGFIYRTETFHDQLILNRLGVLDNPYEVVSVVKKPTWNELVKRYHGLNTYVLNTTDLKSRLNEFLSGEPCAVQRFIKSKGPVSFVCRTTYKKNKIGHIFVITNKISFRNEKEEPRKRCLTSSKDMDNCNVIISSNGKYLEEITPLLKRIVVYMEANLGIEVTEFAGDFIKDDSDHWWFVTCKAFQFTGIADLKGFIVDKPYWSSDSSSEEHEKFLANTEYNRLKRCRLCQVYYPISLLPHQLTIKMITETDQHLRERGVMIQWLDRAEYRHSGHATIYQNYRVCKDCYNLYELTEELRELQQIFGEVFSIPPKQKDSNYGSMPEDWKFESKVAVVVNTEKPKTVVDEARESKPMKLFRMVVIMLDFNEPSKELCGQYEMQFSNFDVVQRYKIEFDGNGGKGVMQKFKMYQFFVNSRTEFKTYLRENSMMTVTMLRGSRVVGRTDLEIMDFMSPIVKHKSFYKVFTSDTSILGYLNCKIAMEEEQYIDVTNIPLRHHSGIFIPPEDFLLCLPLPEEWLEILPDIEYVESKTVSKVRLAQIPPKARPQSAKTKHISRPISRDNHSYRPRSCTAREKQWKLLVEIHTASGIADSEKQWKVFFEVFKNRFIAEEVARSDAMVYFKTMKAVYLKGSDDEVEKCLASEEIEVRIVCEMEIGRAVISLKELKRRKEISDAVSIDIVGRNSVFLDVVLRLKQVNLSEATVMEEISGGARLLALTEHKKDL